VYIQLQILFVVLQEPDNDEAMKNLLRKLRNKDEDLLMQAEKHDNEVNKLDKEIHNLKTELAEVQRELQVPCQTKSSL
jgi:archaellum component FlaC